MANTFKGLVVNADTHSVALCCTSICCVESGNSSAAPTSVQSLGTVARRFIAERLQATTVLLETVTQKRAVLETTDVGHGST